MSGDLGFFYACLAVTAVALLIVAVIHTQRQRTVVATSDALSRLVVMNDDYSRRMSGQGLIVFSWVDRVESKGRLDRYDLNALFYAELTKHERQVEEALDLQESDAASLAAYEAAYLDLGVDSLGASQDRRLSPRRYERIERRLFFRWRRPPAVSNVLATCVVYYESPQGQNAYRRQRSWDEAQLRQGLVEMRRIRAHQSTAKFLRQQERNRMSRSIRFAVLKRDNSTCQQCGAHSLRHGVALHVDHIIPIARGGKTVIENLQTLCEGCNLGKSDRF